MRKISALLLAVSLAGVLVMAQSIPVLSAEAPRISTDELKSRIGGSELVILDVRGSWDWVKSSQKIAGAVRVDPGAVQSWADEYPKDRTIILYCA